MLMRSSRPLSMLLVLVATTLPATAQPVSVTSPATVVSSYRINAGDELEIYVWGEERLQRTVRVLPDGTIAFPLVGQLLAEGQLPQELENTITDGLSSQYSGQVPQVTVSVVSPAGMQFSVLGKVGSPGSFTPGRYVNVLEALSMAGGPNQFANLNNILIVRTVGNDVQTHRIDVSGLLKGSASAAEGSASLARVRTGDTIIVP